jgi:flagellar motility protein MotE (MotC chaperone)
MTGLVTMYESMKPKDAARIFSQLSTSILVDLVEQMNARKMAEILANMEDDAAERLTLAIAARGQAKAEVEMPEILPKIVGGGAS